MASDVLVSQCVFLSTLALGSPVHSSPTPVGSGVQYGLTCGRATAYWPRGSWVGGRDSTCHRQTDKEAESQKHWELRGEKGLRKERTLLWMKARERGRERESRQCKGCKAQGFKVCLTHTPGLLASLEEASPVPRCSWFFLLTRAAQVPEAGGCPTLFLLTQTSHTHSSCSHRSAPHDP